MGDKAALPYGARNSRGKLEANKPLTDDDNDIFKYRNDPPTATANAARAKGSFSIHACLVDFFEHVTNNKIAKGSLGAAIMKYPTDNSFVLIMYAPITLKQEVEIEINPSFLFQLSNAEPLTVCFNDTLVGSKRNWSMKFASKDNLENFCRHIALVKDYLLAVTYNKGTRRVISQDLSLGEEGYQVGPGDQVKAKVSINLTSATHPQNLGDRLRTNESKRFVLGRDPLPTGIEEGVLGMRKKGTRFLVLPPLNPEEAASWEVPPSVTLLVELTVGSIKPRSEVKERKHRSKDKSLAQQPAEKADRAGGEKLTVKFAANTKGGDHDDEEDDDDDDLFAAAVIHHEDGGSGGADNKTAIKARMAKMATAARSPVSAAAVSDMSTALVVADGNSEGVSSELSALLSSLGLEEYEENFRDEGIGIAEISQLDAQELSSLIPKIGHRKRLLVRIKEMQAQHLEKKSDLPWVKPMPSAGGGAPYQIPGSSAYADMFAASFGESPKEVAVSERDIEAAYERGKNAGTMAAREQLAQVKATANERISALQQELEKVQQSKADDIAQFKTVANERFAALQDELEAEKTKNENAKTLVTQLKAQMRETQQQLQQATEDLATSTDRTRQFVANARTKEEELQQTLQRAKAQHEKDQQAAVRRALEKMYQKISEPLQPNDVYDGTQMTNLLKKVAKECLQSM